MNEFSAELVGTFLLILLGGSVNANVSLKKTTGHKAGWIVITAGWGVDSYILARHGQQVTMLENNSLVYAIVAYSLELLAADPTAGASRDWEESACVCLRRALAGPSQEEDSVLPRACFRLLLCSLVACSRLLACAGWLACLLCLACSLPAPLAFASPRRLSARAVANCGPCSVSNPHPEPCGPADRDHPHQENHETGYALSRRGSYPPSC